LEFFFYLFVTTLLGSDKSHGTIYAIPSYSIKLRQR